MQSVQLEDLPPPPGYRQPCNGCGACCRLMPCQEALRRGAPPKAGPCPHIVRAETRILCGLVLRQPALADAMGMGTGCTMQDKWLPAAQQLEGAAA